MGQSTYVWSVPGPPPPFPVRLLHRQSQFRSDLKNAGGGLENERTAIDPSSKIPQERNVAR